MSIEVIEDDCIAVVRPRGKLDILASCELEVALEGAAASGARNLIVDLEQVTFMASAGLRVLLAVAKRLGRDGRAFRICCLNGLVRETFEISGFVLIIDIRATEAEAREGLA